MIDRTHELPVKRQAELVGISRGTVYYHPEPVSEAELALMRRIDELHLEHPFAGSRMLRDFLRLQGVRADRILTPPADPILTRGWTPTASWSAVDKCRSIAASLRSAAR